ncbi:MAG TPA: four-carbon acid sugar kinase family protein [Streptosporangiaceae bacterium]|nr:four-carbon acid sugar kinase family protein [Streptosporangiaceae bacterium]
MRESPRTAAELVADRPAALPDDPALRASIRRARAEESRLLGVLDDDPTGSQAVHDVQVVTVLDEAAYEDAFAAGQMAGGAGVCFVLTNSRSLPEREAADLSRRAARDLLAVARRRGAQIDLISRSDSTLRGHVIAEVAAMTDALRSVTGRGPDAVLFVPAFIEAGRLTVGDNHWARTGAGMVPVGETEFARDRVFGYAASNLREFLVSKSGGTIRPGDVTSITLDDIRAGGTSRIRSVLAGARNGAWVVVNAAEYSDLEAVAHAVLIAGRAGQSFLFRTGPSFVRALSGLDPRAPLRGQDLAPARATISPAAHGLVVIGSHVAQTNRQLDALLAAGHPRPVVLDAEAVLNGAPGAVAETAERVVGGLCSSDVVLCTSRTLVMGALDRSAAEPDDLTVARAVSGALADVVRLALDAQPAWIIAKGGITSHDVAVRGLGIRRAEVAGQLFPGLISVFRPADALPGAIGMPYVVFPGNVGDDEALADVVALMHGAREVGRARARRDAARPSL